MRSAPVLRILGELGRGEVRLRTQLKFGCSYRSASGPLRPLTKTNDAAAQLSHFCRSCILQHFQRTNGGSADFATVYSTFSVCAATAKAQGRAERDSGTKLLKISIRPLALSVCTGRRDREVCLGRSLSREAGSPCNPARHPHSAWRGRMAPRRRRGGSVRGDLGC